MKATKKGADYRQGSDKKRCGNCTMFRPPHDCTAVKGIISKWAVCDYFKRKGKP